MPFDLPTIKPIVPIYFVGDSNTLLFRYLTLDLPLVFAHPIVTSACYVPALSCANLIAGDRIEPAILEFFKREFVIAFSDRWRVAEQIRTSIEYRTWQRTVMPPLHDNYNVETPLALVLMVGTLDLGHLLSEIGTTSDFASDDPRFVDTAFERSRLPLVPISLIRTLVERRLAPIGTALALLRDMGFRDVYVHSLHPPTTDDAKYYRARQVMCSAKVRYKVALLINSILSRLARENGARFLDLWRATTVDGVVDPRLELDGDHLNANAAALTMSALLNDLAIRRGDPSPR